ncbi:protein kinase [bacterium]|jgi:serine/threonine-protein kinase|nr:protein kinase [bacterium]MBP5592524.1 protein kinase [bacterium]
MLERFDNYQLLSKIATGGMAEIFLAKHVNSPVNSMPIAIKKVLKQYSSNPTLVKMFLAEARIICNISHENIVKIYDFGKFEDQYFIAMEYVFGQNLGAILSKVAERDQIMPLNLTIEIISAVLCGLDHAHNAQDRNGNFLNIVHLDMNPNNILISYEGKIKVVDFGIANANYTKKLKGDAGIQGTYAYLSPEQCGGHAVDRRSDIFSVGIILYEMLTGKPLYKNLDNDMAIMNSILYDEIEPINELMPDIDPNLAKIVMKALEKNPNRRYASAMDMREDLQLVYNSLEFDPNSEMLPAFVKKLFPAHFIKMTKIIEQAQTEYLMDELFNNIGELEDLDLEEKKKTEEAARLKEEAERKREKKKAFYSRFGLVSGIVAGLAVIALILKFLFVDPDVEVDMVTVFSSPGGAQIFVDGEDTGKVTPTSLQLEHGKKYIIDFIKDNMIGTLEFTPSSENRQINMQLKPR